jgi:WD40 repeat protein
MLHISNPRPQIGDLKIRQKN